MRTNRKAIALSLTLAGLLSACGGGGDAAREQTRAPQGEPIALDPNPPMSAEDIDAIVDEKRRQAAPTRPAPAPTPTNQRELK